VKIGAAIDEHGWMQDLYYAKGGEREFNCVPVRLSLDDLANLEEAVKAGELPSTCGFFFGKSDGTETEDDLAFIRAARAEIEAGKTVFYDSWW